MKLFSKMLEGHLNLIYLVPCLIGRGKSGFNFTTYRSFIIQVAFHASSRFLQNLRIKSEPLLSRLKKFYRKPYFNHNSIKHLQNYSITTSSLSSTPLESFRTQPLNVLLLSLDIIFTGIVVFLIHLSSDGS